MKKTAVGLALALSFSSSLAKEVTTIGYGPSYDKALMSAKVAAVESVAGSFVVSTLSAKGTSVTEVVNNHSAGVIRKVDVLHVEQEGQQFAVTIKADVDESRVNQIQSSGSARTINNEEIVNKIKAVQSKNSMINSLDVPSDAFVIEEKKFTMKPGVDVSKVSINFTISYNRKWVEDFEKFAKYTAPKKEPTMVQTGSFLISPITPFIEVAKGIERESFRTKQSYSYCFGDYKDRVPDCYEVDDKLSKVVGRTRIQIDFYDQNDIIVASVKERLYNNSLFGHIGAGQDIRYPSLLGYVDVYFKTNTTLLFRKASHDVTFNMNMDNETVKNIHSFKVRIAND